MNELMALVDRTLMVDQKLNGSWTRLDEVMVGIVAGLCRILSLTLGEIGFLTLTFFIDFISLCHSGSCSGLAC